MRHVLSIPILVVSLLAVASAADTPDVSLGNSISDFTLRDFRGKQISLSDFDKSSLVVVAFLGTDCPLNKLYGPLLERMSQTYADQGVAFLGINSNRQDRPTQIAAHALKYGLTFPILKDPDNGVADQFGATRTPEVFVLDDARTIRYCGRIDGQYGFTTGMGYGRQGPVRSDLGQAIDELLSGKPVTIPQTEPVGCLIGRTPKVAPHGDVTYSRQIARIFQDHCVECHRDDEIGPFPMTTFDEVVGWGEMIHEVVEQGRMPPWLANPEHGQFRNERGLTAEEKDLIARWVANGQPEGDPADLPAPRAFASGWQIPEPDVVIPMDDKPFQVPAEGVLDYIYYTVDPHFTEDKWVKAVQVRPGNRSVVHHIIVSVWASEDDTGDFKLLTNFVGYTPGQQGHIYPDDVAYFIPAGARIVFQMHYTPNGIAAEDLSSLGLVFADPSTVKFKAEGDVCGTANFVIPAGARQHVISARQTLRNDVVLIALYPHAHLRAVSFRYDVEYPDGTHETLLDVPRYDFNWQEWYYLATPKRLPAGSILRTKAVYDNSARNMYNPDPTVDVTYGDQTSQEMMWGWYSTLAPNPAAPDR